MPRTLKPILKLREQLKARAKEVGPEEAVQYKERQNCPEVDAGDLLRLSGLQERPLRPDRGP